MGTISTGKSFYDQVIKKIFTNLPKHIKEMTIDITYDDLVTINMVILPEVEMGKINEIEKKYHLVPIEVPTEKEKTYNRSLSKLISDIHHRLDETRKIINHIEKLSSNQGE